MRARCGMKLEDLSPEVFLWELYNPNGLYELKDDLRRIKDGK